MFPLWPPVSVVVWLYQQGWWMGVCFMHGFHSLHACCDSVLFSFQLAWEFHQWEHVLKVNVRKMGNLITWEALPRRSFGEYSKHLHVKPVYHSTQPLQDWLPLTIKILSLFKRSFRILEVNHALSMLKFLPSADCTESETESQKYLSWKRPIQHRVQSWTQHCHVHH